MRKFLLRLDRWRTTLNTVAIAVAMLALGINGATYALIQPPPVVPKPPVAKKANVVPAPNVAGGKVALPSRDQMRVKAGTKIASISNKMRLSMKATAPIPEVIDWTKGGTIAFPLLGNSTYGDCYMTAAAHMFQCWNGNNGRPVEFNEQQLVNRYFVLSGGDNGLSDEQIFPEMKRGYIGPNGSHKIFDLMLVAPTDTTAVYAMAHYFGPQIFTFAVPDGIPQNSGPNSLWDRQAGDWIGGHAIIFSGKIDKDGVRRGETWGFKPGVRVTQKFIVSNEPEIVSMASLEWFDAKGYAPNGYHYTQLSALWVSLGGSPWPASPFPPPVGPTPPLPDPTPDPLPVPPNPPVPDPTPTPVPPIPQPTPTPQPIHHQPLFPRIHHAVCRALPNLRLCRH